MRDRYIPAFIMLLAGAITIVFNIIKKVDINTSLKRLLLILIFFYIIGLIARRLFLKITKPKNQDENNEESPVKSPDQETAERETATGVDEDEEEDEEDNDI